MSADTLPLTVFLSASFGLVVAHENGGDVIRKSIGHTTN